MKPVVKTRGADDLSNPVAGTQRDTTQTRAHNWQRETSDTGLLAPSDSHSGRFFQSLRPSAFHDSAQLFTPVILFSLNPFVARPVTVAAVFHRTDTRPLHLKCHWASWGARRTKKPKQVPQLTLLLSMKSTARTRYQVKHLAHLSARKRMLTVFTPIQTLRTTKTPTANQFESLSSPSMDLKMVLSLIHFQSLDKLQCLFPVSHLGKHLQYQSHLRRDFNRHRN